MDWEKISLLLDVIHKASSAGPKYAWIVSGADSMLSLMQQSTTVSPSVAPAVPKHHALYGAEPVNSNAPTPEPAA